MTNSIRFAAADGVGQIVLARPASRNAMNQEFVEELDAATSAVSRDPTVRAVCITAEGKHFCVGGDLHSFASAVDPVEFVERLADGLHRSILRLTAMDALVVVGVRGAAAGAGLSLATIGDIVIAGVGASFSMAYTAVGLTSDGGASWYLPRVIGLRRAQELAYTNRTLSAEEARQFGLVTRVVPDELVENEAFSTAQRIANGPTRAYGSMKRLFQSGQNSSLEQQLDAEKRSIGVAIATQDARRAINAFLDRRRPESQNK